MLRVLDVGSDAILFPAATLLNQVRSGVKPTPTYAEFDRALLDLETGRLIVGVRDGLDEQVVKYKLTDAGKAKLAEYS
jgi:DNA-binding PadR family transcriptional regulator